MRQNNCRHIEQIIDYAKFGSFGISWGRMTGRTARNSRKAAAVPLAELPWRRTRTSAGWKKKSFLPTSPQLLSRQQICLASPVLHDVGRWPTQDPSPPECTCVYQRGHLVKLRLIEQMWLVLVP